MRLIGELKSWLPWGIKDRFLIVTFVFATDYAIEQISPSPNGVHSIEYLGGFVILWYILNLFSLIYDQMGLDYSLQAHRIVFRDTGIGTAPSNLEKLFERFRPAFPQGTGLRFPSFKRLRRATTGTFGWNRLPAAAPSSQSSFPIRSRRRKLRKQEYMPEAKPSGLCAQDSSQE